jgi:mRNA-degrading endonuclease RelE of RelBE toxin-antitoxin system
MEAALQQQLVATQGEGLFDAGDIILNLKRIRLVGLGGAAVEVAKFATRDADVCDVDVAVDLPGDHFGVGNGRVAFLRGFEFRFGEYPAAGKVGGSGKGLDGGALPQPESLRFGQIFAPRRPVQNFVIIHTTIVIHATKIYQKKIWKNVMNLLPLWRETKASSYPTPNKMRKIIYSKEFEEFFEKLQPNVQAKVRSSIGMVRELSVIPANLVKKLTGTDYYELRISVDNEYRVILFSIDHANIIQATKIFILNGFVKKSTKDYRKQLVIAQNILNRFDDETTIRS